MAVAFAPAACLEVHLERRRLAHGGDGGGDGLLGEEGAAEVGVEDGAGEVEDRAQRRGRVEAGGEGGGVVGGGLDA